MNKHQTNVLNMSLAVSEQLTSLTARHALPALTAGHDRLKAKLAEIKTQGAIQALPVTGKTVARNEVLSEATDATLLVGRIVLSHARAEKLPDLEAKVNLRPSTFTRTRIALRATLMQQVHDAATPVLPAITALGVTAQVLTDLQAKIDAVDAIHSLPRMTIVARKVATEALVGLFSELKALLETDLDPLVDFLRKTDAEGWAAYRAARLVIDQPGVPAESAAPASAAAAPAEKIAA